MYPLYRVYIYAILLSHPQVQAKYNSQNPAEHNYPTKGNHSASKVSRISNKNIPYMAIYLLHTTQEYPDAEIKSWMKFETLFRIVTARIRKLYSDTKLSLYDYDLKIPFREQWTSRRESNAFVLF